jgi:hypothetical protein
MTDPKPDNTKAPASKPAVKVAVKDASGAKPKPDAKDDLKALPLAEVEKKTGIVAGWAHPSRGAKATGAIWPE